MLVNFSSLNKKERGVRKKEKDKKKRKKKKNFISKREQIIF
jgi:hypothetical protein